MTEEVTDLGTATVGQVLIPVKDLDDAVAFYRDTLGLHFLFTAPPQMAFLECGRGAIETFERFGRGNHPARLNMGNCFAYACARTLGVPLLFKGDDFAQTDISLG